MVKAWQIIAPLGLGLFVLGCSGSDTAGEGGTSSTTGGGTAAPTVTAAQVVDVFNANCVTCHSGEKAKEGLHLDTIEGVLKGSENGAVVVAGKAADSKIVKAMRGQEGAPKMPPQGTVPEADIKKVEDWINAGAKAE